MPDLGNIDQSQASTGESNMKPLTLIVAATRTMGIGNKGQLPWPMLKQEMAYFARITKRVPSSPVAESGSGTDARNIVIMGRRTWESIPPKFRPLKDRLNVVLSRSGLGNGAAETTGPDVIVEKSLEAALHHLDRIDEQNGQDGAPTLGHLFVIGGGSVYADALKSCPERATQVLLTKITTDFECDTTFPLDLDSPDAAKAGWKRCSQSELGELVGEDVASGSRHESGVNYEFTLYRRRAS
jgi:dihydrofolate reductase